MLSDLSFRTRQIVEAILSNRGAIIAGVPVPKFNDAEAKVLSIIAEHRAALPSGAELARTLVEMSAGAALPVQGQTPDCVSKAVTRHWRFGRIRARNFRGLAPGGAVWEHDFEATSHLLFGPNGCGKSSLLGAFAWCLTGRIFRDDRPPSEPELVSAYACAGRPSASKRPDALTLTTADGTLTNSDEAYWVELQLIAQEPDGERDEVWVRRHSEEGLAKSQDGRVWAAINNLRDAGVDELDAELHILVPARVPHLQFGKSPDLVHLFAQVVGLDDLEQIGEIAGKAHTAITKESNKLRREDLVLARSAAAELAEEIRAQSCDELKTLARYDDALSDSRTLEDLKVLGTAASELVESCRTRLASDLGIAVPSAAERDPLVRKSLENLPGQVQLCLEEMSKPIASLFPLSVGYAVPTADSLDKLEAAVLDLERKAKDQVAARLAWAVEEAKEPKLQLLLLAAESFDDAAGECPVCSQSLEAVADIARRLRDLRGKSAHPHLKKSLRDLQLSLLNELDGLVSPAARRDADMLLPDRVRRDWEALKGHGLTGLLAPVAIDFNRRIADVALTCDPDAPVEPAAALTRGKGDDPFTKLWNAFSETKNYISLLRCLIRDIPRVRASLTNILKPVNDGGDSNSLAEVISRGRAANEKLAAATQVHRNARMLWTKQNELRLLSEKILMTDDIGAATIATKDLGKLARKEALDIVETVGPRMKQFYSVLYDDFLAVDMVTPGNAANPNIKDEINAYFRADDHRVPVGPFSNAGRLRALMLCFVFALLEHSKGSLGLILLDDPALSLDDEHKARLLDHLVQPWMERRQVILATHYENFFKVAEPVFKDASRLQLTPRRSCRDAVSFEPGDLLQRVESALASPNCKWREAAVNLRRWVERALHTLSAYSPEPFVVFNNIKDSVLGYARIADPQIATANRDNIVRLLQAPPFARVMHRAAHDEEPTESEARDALRDLLECRRITAAETERLKQSRTHALLARAVAPVAAIEALTSLPELPKADVRIIGRAAAATNGVGVTWIEDVVTTLNELQVVLITHDTLLPIIDVGQYALIDPRGSLPMPSEMAIVQTEHGERYVRRYWNTGGIVYLEGLNAVRPAAPVVLASGKHQASRIAGVYFDGVNALARKGEGAEWVPVASGASILPSGLLGVRVTGSSMDPIARDEDVVLVREVAPLSLVKGALACVDIESRGAVIKRCYPSDKEWVLSPISPLSIEQPIAARVDEILRVYRVVGILFTGGSPSIELPAKARHARSPAVVAAHS